MINNIKPSRSQNTLVNLEVSKRKVFSLYKKAIRENLEESAFYEELNKILSESMPVDASKADKNKHSSDDYHAIHFTCRQLIKYKNPFILSFNEVRKLALKDKENPLSQALLGLDTSAISRDVRFFYPFEVQITDYESHLKNTQGEASHHEYKKSQQKSAMRRIFKPILELRENAHQDS